jgi:hypothetical protein
MYNKYLLLMLFIGDSYRRVVHNSWLETRKCKLNEINPENRELFSTLEDAIKEGYEKCQYCMGNNDKRRRKK